MRKYAQFAILCCAIVTIPSRAAKSTTPSPPSDDARPEIVQLYNTLQTASLAEQRVVLRTLTPEVKSALWRYNLQKFLETRPSLSREQRNIIEEALIIVSTAHWFEITPSTPGWEEKMQRLRAHKVRAAAFFDRDTIYEAFVKIGGGVATVEADWPPLTVSSERPTILPESTFPPCSCASWFDCAWWAGRTCFMSDECTTRMGCGFYGDEACIGVCGWTPPPV